MRRVDQSWKGSPLRVAVHNAARRYEWFLSGATPGQLRNLTTAAACFAAGSSRTAAAPVMLKIDLSPVCNLSCTFCVHADPSSMPAGMLDDQRFSSSQRLSLDRYETMLGQVEGRTAAVALYYVGDPLVHPDLPEFCGRTAAAGMRSHVSTNFSFVLSDERIAALVHSGMSHLTVCIDSMQQDRYELTRVGGRIDLVIDNLERLLALRRAEGLRRPDVEVQFIAYQHNVDELDATAEWCRARGVDQFTSYWGNLHNYGDVAPTRLRVGAPRRGRRSRIPLCGWPHFAMTVRYDGDALPCCYHRVAEQYGPGGDARPIGNVFDHGVGAVWSSSAYRDLRRLVRNPAGMDADRRDRSFCHGCNAVFETDLHEVRRTADDHRWDEVFLRRTDGTIVRHDRVDG